MSTYDKSGVSAAQADAARAALAALLKEEANRRCAECGARGPTWASVNLGVFVCLNCSGVHRSLGTHISKVRSATLDTWLPSQVAWAGRMGNARAAAFWEARLPPSFARPPEGDMAALSAFIGAKYRDRAYASTAYGPPPTLDNHEGHPFLAAGAGGAGAGGSVQAPPVAAPAQAAAPAAATAPAPPPPPAPRPAPELIDLLGMHEPTPVAAPASAAAPAAPTPAAWAAFEPEPPPPSLPSTTTAAAPLAAAFADHDWDVFQAAEPALAGAFAAAPGRSGGGGGGAAGSNPPPAVAPAPPPPPPAPARPDHTAAIMRMFDAVPGTAAGSPGGTGRRAGPLLPDLSGGSGRRVTPPFGAPFLQAQAPPPSASPTRRGL